MFFPLIDPQTALAVLGEFHPADFCFRNFCARPGVSLFVDSEDSPRALLAMRGSDVMLHAPDPDVRAAAMDDILHYNFAANLWPDDAALKSWEGAERRHLFLNSSPINVWEAGLAVGFELPADAHDDRPPANLYWWKGAPHLSTEIYHSCRIGRGLELWNHMRQGIGYDPEGEYVRIVLRQQPSFVVEVQGDAVSWSTIHLNGAMGMIYTPPEHRRKGYARSLSAFQIDHQLRIAGFACCHVVSDNVASYSMLLNLGATRDETPIGWRVLLWPELGHHGIR